MTEVLFVLFFKIEIISPLFNLGTNDFLVWLYHMTLNEDRDIVNKIITVVH